MSTKLQQRIVEFFGHAGQSLSIADLAARISDQPPERVLRACMILKLHNKLGRVGSGQAGDPFIFFLSPEMRLLKERVDAEMRLASSEDVIDDNR